MDLVEFITARLDEDEAAAEAAHPGPWVLEEETGGFGPVAWISVPFGRGMPTAKSGLTRFAPLGTQDAGTIRHIARHDPARVLCDVAADRMLILTWESQAGYDLPDGVHEGRDPDERAADELIKWELYDVLKIRAAIWSGHPDYRAEWKP